MKIQDAIERILAGDLSGDIRLAKYGFLKVSLLMDRYKRYEVENLLDAYSSAGTISLYSDKGEGTVGKQALYVWDNYPKLHPYLYVTLGFDRLVVFNPETIQYSSTFNLGLNSNAPKAMATDQDIVLHNLQDGFNYKKLGEHYQEVNVVNDMLIKLVALTPTSMLEVADTLIDWSFVSKLSAKYQLIYNQLHRYFLLMVRKSLEYPSQDFDDYLVDYLRDIKYDPSILAEYGIAPIERVVKSYPKLYRGFSSTYDMIEDAMECYEGKLSWTPEKKTGVFFAKRFGHGRYHAYLISIAIPKRFILAEYTDTGEPEVLVDPAFWNNAYEFEDEDLSVD